MDPGPSSNPRPSSQGDTDFNCSTSKRICKYDVFISFRSTDTRNNFTDHLYNHLIGKGIFTFKDDKLLEKGQPISPQLLQAIKDSRVSIIVFSKDYAASTWCLEEMATIADCQNDFKQTVFPVFYDVSPSDVRYQTGLYEDAIRSHRKKFESKVDRWKRAMRGLANFVGWDVRDKPQSLEIEKIVQEVIKTLGHKFSGHADDLIGIQPRVHELENLLKLSSEGDSCRVLGIWGMGGIGKTTLITVLYDIISYQFDACCFIENVSQNFKDGGAIAVQKQILRQTLDEKNLETYSPSKISGIVRYRLPNIKVLVALDNVDQLEQLEKLAIIPKLLCAGSRIIIATRDEHILKVYGADAIYKVPLLNNDDARELFCIKAFKSDDPGGRFVELISEVLKYTQSLPLAIRVMGSFLCTRRDAILWRDALDRLRNNPNNQIMDVLQISFEGLESDQKEIFLHIACFFKGEREDYVKRILDCWRLDPHIGIEVLEEKSLITIRDQEIHMHDMMQELGKKIVRGESRRDPGTWSRLWLYQDFNDVLASGMATEKIKAIVLNQKYVFKYSQLQVEELSKMKGLELLILYEMNCSGRLNFLSNRLHFLLWHDYPFTYLPSDFQPNKLVELNMPNSNIERLWEGIKNLPCLKRLDLSNSINVMEMPNFEGIPNLELLDFTGCKNLTEVHPSVGILEKLAFLSLRNCSNLVSLYLGNVSNLSSLRVLYLSGCTKLENTPDFTGMSKLEHLDLERCISLSTIHESIGALVKLNFLSLRHCTNLVRIPNSVNTMKSLETLYLSNCLKLMNLPLGQRSELEDSIHLDIVRYVPSGRLLSLIFLDLGFCNLREVPDAIGELRLLERLNVQGNHFFSLPFTIYHLFRLAYLNLSHCHELQFLPWVPSKSGSIIGGMYFKKVSGSRNHRSGLYMFDCLKFVERELGSEYLALAWLLRLVENPSHFRCGFDIVIPGSVIPKWIYHQFIGGSAIRIVHSDVDDNWIGVAFCVVFEVNYHQSIFDSSHDSSSSPLAQSSSLSLSPPPPHPLYLSFESENTEEIFGMPLGVDLEKSVGSKHLWLIYISRPHCHFVKTRAHITFKARPGLEIKKWGLRMIFKLDIMLMNLDMYNVKKPSKLRNPGKECLCLDYVHETQRWRSSGLKIQLPYNWLVTEEEGKENIGAKEKENSISMIGLGQTLLAPLSSSSSSLQTRRDTSNESARRGPEPPHREGESNPPHQTRSQVDHIGTLQQMANAIALPAQRVPCSRNPPSRDPSESTASANPSRTPRRISPPPPPPSITPLLTSLTEFRKLKPPTFSGTGFQEDPSLFLEEIERLLQAIGCTPAKYVELASFQLHGTAREWFTTFRSQSELDGCMLQWRDFYDSFMETFLPRGAREKRAREFEHLVQGDMSVMEYMNEFLWLSKYAPHLVTDPYMRVSRFVFGLRFAISRFVPVMDDITFEQVVSLAIRAETSMNEVKYEQRQSKKARRSESKGEMASEEPIFRSPRQQRSAPGGGLGGSSFHPPRAFPAPPGGQQKSQDASIASFNAPVCRNCGMNHSGTCYHGLAVCYSCGQPGHLHAKCPMVVSSTDRFTSAAGSSAPSVNQREGTGGGSP